MSIRTCIINFFKQCWEDYNAVSKELQDSGVIIIWNPLGSYAHYIADEDKTLYENRNQSDSGHRESGGSSDDRRTDSTVTKTSKTDKSGKVN